MAERRLVWKAEFETSGAQGIKDMDNQFTGMKGNIQKLEQSMGAMGKSLTKKVTAPLLGVGVASLKTTADFDDGMSNVKALTGATGKDFDDLREKAIQLGNDTAYSALDATEGMQVLASAGRDTNEILDMSKDMFDLMSAATIDSETAASVLNNTMAQYNLEAKDAGKIADVFAKGQAESAASVENLEYIMGQAGGTMASMNMDMEQSVAMAGQLANAGTPIGQVGSIINAMGREIKANAKEFKELGIEVYDSTGQLKDMGSVMGDVEKALEGKTDAQRDEMLATVFSGQAQKGAIDWLSKGSDAYAELTEDIYGAEGAAQKMAETNEDNIGGAFRSLSSSIGTLMIGVGDTIKPLVKDLATFVEGLTNKFNSLDDDSKKTIVAIAGIAMAIGPVLLAGSKLIGAFGKVSGALNPVTLAVVAVVGALVYMWNTSETFRNAVIRIFHNVKAVIEETMNVLGALWEQHGETIMTVMGAVGGFIKTAIEVIVEVFSSVVGVISGFLIGDWTGMWENVRGIFEGVIDGMKKLWSGFKDLLSEGAKAKVEAVTDAFHKAIDKVRESWRKLKDFMANPIKGTVEAAKKGAGWVKSKVSGSHRTGKDRIPKQGYVAELHKDEMVLTKSTADKYRDMGGTKDSVPSFEVPAVRTEKGGTVHADFSPTIQIQVEGNADDSTAKDIGREVKRAVQKEMDKFFIKLQLQR